MPENNRLSGREIEILGLVATGASNKEIAQKLFITTNTVKVHLRNIFSKIGAASRTEAAMYAVRQGIVQPGTVPEKSENEIVEARSAGSDTVSLPEDGLSGSTLDLLLARVRENRWIGFAALGGLAAIVILAIVLSREFTIPAATNSPPLPTIIPRWQELADMPTARYGLAAAVYENQIYAIGGETVQGVTGVVERYDPETNTWEERSPKPLPVTDVEGAVIGGLIYVPGGRLSSGDVTDVLEIYDPREDKWSQGAGLPAALSAYALAAFEGRLFLFGGWDGEDYLDSVYEYDPEQEIWSLKTPMSSPRGYAGAVVVGTNIYVIGGQNGVNALSLNEVYIPDRDEGEENPWMKAASLPEGLKGMGIASIANIVVVIGGVGGEGISVSLEYIPHTDAWQEFGNPLTQPWVNLNLVSLGSNVYAIGGSFDGSPSSRNLAYQAIYTVVIPLLK